MSFIFPLAKSVWILVVSSCVSNMVTTATLFPCSKHQVISRPDVVSSIRTRNHRNIDSNIHKNSNNPSMLQSISASESEISSNPIKNSLEIANDDDFSHYSNDSQREREDEIKYVSHQNAIKILDFIITPLRCRGGSQKSISVSGGAQDRTGSTEKKLSSSIPSDVPRVLSVLNMAIAMSLHYLAYSLARPSTMSLFTSSTTGFGGSAIAFPLAMAFISPTSLGLLLLYGRILNATGPRAALRRTTYICSFFLGFSSLAIRILSGGGGVGGGQLNAFILPSLVCILFVFRESYVQLLTSQYWSFLASVVDPSQSARWFAPISGLTSITSALAGIWVSPLVKRVGLTGLLHLASIILLSTLFFTERAYMIADKHGFNPIDEIKQKASTKSIPKSKKRMANKANATTATTTNEEGMVKKASELFARIPVLKALFLEILAGQGLSTLLNVCFVTKLSEAIPDDDERAGYTGKFFAIINTISSFLQFGILPSVVPRIEAGSLWKIMPLFVVGTTIFQSFEKDPSLLVVSGSFMLMKTLEFSVRRMLDEMVYVPLDFNSRFVGKEIISVFGYRFGKSGMSLALSGLSSLFGDFGVRELSSLSTGASMLWLMAAWNVGKLVPTRANADLQYKKNKGMIAADKKH
mmetsp:Transcript_14490/g.20661  ORF Transcript_14490/g.20661 Transcript_14490/m.20661 type:complete len:638 (+) Transcript_14490:569-2482(+)